MSDEPWGKLLFVCAALAIGAGLTPAASAYTAYFCQRGIAANVLCLPGLKKCEIQEAFIGQTVLQAGVLAKMQEIAGAYSFQRYGGKRCLQGSANMHMSGWLLFAYLCCNMPGNPLLWVFPIYLIDMSRGLIKYVPYVFLTHFPGQTGTVLALGNGGHQAASVFALVLIFISKFLDIYVLGLSIIQASLGLLLLLLGPSLLPPEEGSESTPGAGDGEEGEHEGGEKKTPQKKGACDETCAAYKDTYYSLLPKLPLHLFVVFTFGIGPLWSAQYQAIEVVWGNMLFKDEADPQASVDLLASSIAISTFVTNVVISPVVAANLPRVGLAVVCLGLSILQLVAELMIPIPTFLAQGYIGFVAAMMYAVEPALQGEHLFAFVDLRFAGMAAFVWSQFMFVAYSNGTNWESGLFTKANAITDRFGAYKDTLHYCMRIGSYSYLSYSIIMFLCPLPDRPVVAAYKQKELSSPYGCTNFDQVAKIIRYNLDLTEKALLQQQARDERSLAELTGRSHIPSFRDRLSQNTYDELSKLVLTGNLFWKPTHVPVKATGFMMAGVAMPAAQFESMLRTVADVDSFGSGHAKSLAFLKEEMANKRSGFEFDEENPDMLVRVVTIIVLRITVTFNDSTYYLLEVGSMYTDDSVKKVFRYPAQKKLIGGSVDNAIRDLLKDLGIDDSDVEIDKENTELFVETQASESYPGLLTRYDKKLVPIQLSTTDDDSLSRIGLKPEPGPWQKGRESSSTRVSVTETTNAGPSKMADMFEWLRREEIRDREPTFMITYPKPKSNRPSPQSIGVDIHTLLADRRWVVELLRTTRSEQDWVLKDMLVNAKTAQYIRSLPYWLLDEQFQYHNEIILSTLKNMIIEKTQQPHPDVIIESLILDLMVYKFKAKLRRRASMKL